MNGSSAFFRTLFVSGFFLLFASAANAQGVGDVVRLAQPGLGSNPRALGMGGAYVALADDALGVLDNPAGLALMKKIEIGGGLTYNHASNTADFLGIQSDYSNSSTRLSSFAFSFPLPTIQGSMAFGLAYQSQKSFDNALNFSGFNAGGSSMIQWLVDPDLSQSIPYQRYLTDGNGNTAINGNLTQSGTTLSSGSLDVWTFSGAVEAAPNVFVGLSLDVITGEYEMNRDYFEDDFQGEYTGTELAPGETFTNDFRTFYFTQNLVWDVSGFDFRLGLLYQMQDFARFGAAVHFPRWYSVKEEFAYDAQTEWGDGTVVGLPEDNYWETEYDVDAPFSFSLGGSVTMFGAIVSGSARLTDYTQSEFQADDGFTPTEVSDVNKNIKSALGTSLDYNLGAEYTIPVANVRVRAGYAVIGSPYDGDPADYDRKYLTGGVGFLMAQSFSFDIAVVRGMWKTYGDNYDAGVSRVYQDIETTEFVVGFSARF